MSNYLKYQIKYSDVYTILNSNNYKKIIIYLDLAGISKGFYSSSVIRMETANYAESKKMPTLYLNELKNFLSMLFDKFKYYSPQFVLMFDGGQCQQNTSVSNEYKADRRAGDAANKFLVEEETLAVFKLIKEYYFSRVEELFSVPNYCRVVDLKEYESDLVPHYVRSKCYLGSGDGDVMNLVVALDKDLLQTCKFKNVYQATSIYLKAKRRLDMRIYNDSDAIEYIYPKFKRGILTAQYISTILSISGDKADNISGIRGYGPAKAIKVIMQSRLDCKLIKNCTLPSELEPYRDMLIRNYKMIDFEEQISRLPNKVTSRINSILS